MPITYQLDKIHRLIRTQCVGNVTFEEVIDHFQVLEQEPECPNRLHVILDLSQLTSLPESDQLRLVSREIGRISERVQFEACAVVACTDVIFGMARMFEVFAEKHFLMTRIFRALNEAENWLVSQQSPIAPG